MPIWLPKTFERPISFKPKVKPTGTVEIDWKHPLAKGLVQDFELINDVVDLVNGDKLTLNGNSKLVNGELVITNVGDNAETISRLANNHCVQATYRARDNGIWNYVFDTNGGRELFAFSNSNRVELYVDTNKVGDYANTYVPNYKDNHYHTLFINLSINEVYLDGVKFSAFNASNFTQSSILYLGSRYTNTDPIDGAIKNLRVWNHNLSPQEIKSLHENPYQFLVPK